jgi:hypothetical protein
MDPSPFMAGLALECTCVGTATGEMHSMVLMTPLSKKAKPLSEKWSCSFRVDSPQEHQFTSSSLYPARLLVVGMGPSTHFSFSPTPGLTWNPIVQPCQAVQPPLTRKTPSHLRVFALAIPSAWIPCFHSLPTQVLFL